MNCLLSVKTKQSKTGFFLSDDIESKWKEGIPMDWIKTINTAIAYMEDHLNEQITLEDIAKHVNLSVFHFHRAFSMLTGMSPSEYLRKRRLSKAAAELIDSDDKVIDIALKYGYETPESFTKSAVSTAKTQSWWTMRRNWTHPVLQAVLKLESLPVHLHRRG